MFGLRALASIKGVYKPTIYSLSTVSILAAVIGTLGIFYILIIV